MTDQKPVETIEGVFRSGSLTAIGIVLGFSLSFFARWAALPGPWARADLVAGAFIVLGTIVQMKALADLLAVTSLMLANYNRAIRIFKGGILLIAIGIVIALGQDIFGGGQNVLRG
jgi:hypothetical protein